MPHYDSLYRALMGYRHRSVRWAGSSIPDALPPGTFRHGAYTPIETGYITQENTGEPAENSERRSVYDPGHSWYDGHPAEYQTPEPGHELVSGMTPPIIFPPPAADDLRPPEYDDALMDDWLMGRAMNEPAELMGTLDERTDSTADAVDAPDTTGLDQLAAGMDPLAPEAFRKVRDLPLDDLEEDELFSAAALLTLFAPPGASRRTSSAASRRATTCGCFSIRPASWRRRLGSWCGTFWTRSICQTQRFSRSTIDSTYGRRMATTSMPRCLAPWFPEGGPCFWIRVAA